MRHLIKSELSKYQRSLEKIKESMDRGNFEKAASIANDEAKNSPCGICQDEFKDLSLSLALASGFCSTANCQPMIKEIKKKAEDLINLFDPNQI